MRPAPGVLVPVGRRRAPCSEVSSADAPVRTGGPAAFRSRRLASPRWVRPAGRSRPPPRRSPSSTPASGTAPSLTAPDRSPPRRRPCRRTPGSPALSPAGPDHRRSRMSTPEQGRPRRYRLRSGADRGRVRRRVWRVDGLARTIGVEWARRCCLTSAQDIRRPRVRNEPLTGAPAMGNLMCTQLTKRLTNPVSTTLGRGNGAPDRDQGRGRGGWCVDRDCVAHPERRRGQAGQCGDPAARPAGRRRTRVRAERPRKGAEAEAVADHRLRER